VSPKNGDGDARVNVSAIRERGGVSSHQAEDGPDDRSPALRHTRRRRDPTEGNARLTASAAAVLFVLLAAEGVTILQVHRLITAHVFIGMLLVPPILLKMGSTFWKFARYYLGDPAYRQKGPPPLALRLLGPLVVIFTLTVIGSGIALLLGPFSWRSSTLLVHKASFILWLGALTLHVLGHLLDTARLAPRDWLRHTRHQVGGAGARQWSIAISIACGLILAVVVVPKVGPWVAAGLVGHQ
jgi:Flp pilus assembly protein TadB